MNRLDRLIRRLQYIPTVSNEDVFDLVKDYWDDVKREYWDDVDDELADEIGVTPTALSELLEVHRHTFDYANIGGNSSVRGYDHGEDWFVVEFSDGSRYLYTLKSTTPEALDWMRKYAIEGKGLNSYIMRLQRENYAGRNYKGNITIRPGMETYSPMGYHRLKLIEAFRNTMTITQSNRNVHSMEHHTLAKYQSLIEASGPDGLDPTAREIMSVGLEHCVGGSPAFSFESFDGKPVQPSMEDLLDSIKKFFMTGKDKGIYDTVNKGFLQKLVTELKKYADPSWVKTHGVVKPTEVEIDGANLINDYDKVVGEFVQACKANRIEQHKVAETAFKNMDEVLAMIDKKTLGNSDNVRQAMTIMQATRALKRPIVEVPKAEPKSGKVKTLTAEEISAKAKKLLELFETLTSDQTFVKRWNDNYINSHAWMDWKYVGKKNYNDLYSQVKDPKFTDLYRKTLEKMYDLVYIGAEFHHLRPYIMAEFQLIEKSVAG